METCKTVTTGYGEVRVYVGKGVRIEGNVTTRKFARVAAAQKWSRKNVELGGGDEVDDYILSLEVSHA